MTDWAGDGGRDLITDEATKQAPPAVSWILIETSDQTFSSLGCELWGLLLNCVKLFMMFGLSSVRIYDIKNLAFAAHRSNRPPTAAIRTAR